MSLNTVHMPMKKKLNLLAAGAFLAAVNTAVSQPIISSVTLSGQPANANDTSHPYTAFSVSPGASIAFRVNAGGTPPLHYQWQFNHADLPDQTNSTLALLSVQLTNAGDYTVAVTNVAGSTNRSSTLTVDPAFTKITTGFIVTDAGFSQGGTWGDYNNDGLLDLFVFNGQTAGNVPFLYRNNGDGTFTKVTSGPPVNLAAQASSACWGDYDNDGDLDLYLATPGQNLLYHNNGNGTFTRITTGRIVTDAADTLGAAWVDYDQDGFLDMLTTTYDPATNSHCFLYRNNGDGTFSSVTNISLVTDLGSSLGCVWGDYDNDGYPDLFVCGGRGTGPGSPLAPNRLYRNNGNSTFTRITTGSIATDVGYGTSCAWGDYDNDGLLDLFVGNVFGLKNFLYHNNGDGTFTGITNSIVTSEIGAAGSFGCAWGDYDNDGFLDLLVTNEGDPSMAPTAVNFLYHNNGDGTFTKVTNGSPVNEYSDSWGCSWVDYDNDGFLDLFAARGDGRGNYLYRNNGNSNVWLTVKLVGTVSNRPAIGARVRVQASFRAANRWQLRQITGGSGFCGHNELRANFGLGDATNADTVRIEWPSGTVQEFHNVAVNQILTITEPPRLLPSTSNGVPQFSLKGGRGFQYDILASTDLTAWSPIGTVTITNLSGTAQIVDTNAPSAGGRFYRALSR
jgi:hypothetical protein